jgi:hypothetical protein
MPAPAKDPHYLFHTQIENSPWWQVDLQNVYDLTKIKLFNRLICIERARTLQVFISSNGSSWEKVFSNNGQDIKTMNIDVNGKKARFVKLQLAERNYLHLYEVQVFGYNTTTRATSATIKPVAVRKPTKPVNTSTSTKSSGASNLSNKCKVNMEYYNKLKAAYTKCLSETEPTKIYERCVGMLTTVSPDVSNWITGGTPLGNICK